MTEVPQGGIAGSGTAAAIPVQLLGLHGDHDAVRAAARISLVLAEQGPLTVVYPDPDGGGDVTPLCWTVPAAWSAEAVFDALGLRVEVAPHVRWGELGTLSASEREMPTCSEGALSDALAAALADGVRVFVHAKRRDHIQVALPLLPGGWLGIPASLRILPGAEVAYPERLLAPGPKTAPPPPAAGALREKAQAGR